jgi:hypothetical protein
MKPQLVLEIAIQPPPGEQLLKESCENSHKSFMGAIMN